MARQRSGLRASAAVGGHTAAGLSLTHKGLFSRTMWGLRPLLLDGLRVQPECCLEPVTLSWFALFQERKNPRPGVEHGFGGGTRQAGRQDRQERGPQMKGQLWAGPGAVGSSDGGATLGVKSPLLHVGS